MIRENAGTRQEPDWALAVSVPFSRKEKKENDYDEEFLYIKVVNVRPPL